MTIKKSIGLALGLLFASASLLAQQTQDYLSKESTYDHAVELYNNGHYSAAYNSFDDFIRAEEKNSQLMIEDEITINSRLYRALSATLAGRGQGIKQVDDFLQAYPEHPNTSLAKLELGKYYFEKRDFNNALYYLEAVDYYALDEDKQNDYNLSMGYTYFIKKRFAQAINYLQPASNSNSQYQIPATYYLGLSQYFQGNHSDALKELFKVKDDLRYSPAIPFYVSKIYFGQGEYDKLIAYAEPKLASNLEYKADIEHLLGQAYFNKQEYQRALPYLEAYGDSGKKMTPEATYQLAYTLYQMKSYDKAIAQFEKLNVVDTELGQTAMHALAESYLRVNEKQKARNAFAQASRMNHNSEIQENASYNHAKLSYELGFDNEALTLINAYLEKYPRTSNKVEAEEMLIDLLVSSNNYKDALQAMQNMDNRSERVNRAMQKVAYLRAVEVYNGGYPGKAKGLFDIVREHPYQASYVALADYWTGEIAYEFDRYDIANSYMTKYLASTADASMNSHAHYTKGYSLYNKKQYSQALQQFQQVGSNVPFSIDASVRAADCHFAMRNYAQALSKYSAATSSSNSSADYASYQIAVLNGLQGDSASKLRKLKSLYTSKPSSAYADDALFEYGRVYTTQENYPQAISAYEDLLRKYPKSEKVKNAYLQLGLINSNQNNNNEALRYYDKVVQGYPGSEEADAALKSIKEIYIETGRPEEYVRYIKRVKNVDLSTSEEEQIMYSAAEAQFQNGDCASATAGFSNYIRKYSRGLYKANAHFYRGECLIQQQKNAEAIADYEVIINMPNNKFTERSLLRLARHYYRSQDYAKTIEYYSRVESSAASSNYTDEINRGLMMAYEKSGQRSRAYSYASKNATNTSLNSQETIARDFLLAHQKYLNGSKLDALNGFRLIAAKSRTSYGAESRFYLAEDMYLNKQYQPSIDAAYRIPDETPSEDYWVAKGFILIADNYYALGELFQAKATLQSVIDNYSGDDLKQIARSKLAKIEQEERSKSNLLESSPTDILQLDDSRN